MIFELAYTVAQSWVHYIGEAGFSINRYVKVTTTGFMSR